MRGGTIPLLAWGLLLLALLVLNWIWTGDAIQVAEFGFACVVIFGAGAVVLAMRPREALRKGPPRRSPESSIETVTAASLGSVLLATGAAAILYGFAFGLFLVYMGGGLFVLSVGIVVREVLSERAARRLWRRRGPR